MKKLDVLAAVLVVVGGLNWGLVAVAEFDLVATLFGLEFGETNAATGSFTASSASAPPTRSPSRRRSAAAGRPRHHLTSSPQESNQHQRSPNELRPPRTIQGSSLPHDKAPPMMFLLVPGGRSWRPASESSPRPREIPAACAESDTEVARRPTDASHALTGGRPARHARQPVRRARRARDERDQRRLHRLEELPRRREEPRPQLGRAVQGDRLRSTAPRPATPS